HDARVVVERLLTAGVVERLVRPSALRVETDAEEPRLAAVDANIDPRVNALPKDGLQDVLGSEALFLDVVLVDDVEVVRPPLRDAHGVDQLALLILDMAELTKLAAVVAGIERLHPLDRLFHELPTMLYVNQTPLETAAPVQLVVRLVDARVP